MPAKKASKASVPVESSSAEGKSEETLGSSPENSDDDVEVASVGTKPSKSKAFTSTSLLDAMAQPSMSTSTTSTSSSSTNQVPFSSSSGPSSSLPTAPGGGFTAPDSSFAKFFKPTESISSNALVDIPHIYLYDRSRWSEFKKILTACGGT